MCVGERKARQATKLQEGFGDGVPAGTWGGEEAVSCSVGRILMVRDVVRLPGPGALPLREWALGFLSPLHGQCRASAKNVAQAKGDLSSQRKTG